MTVSEVRQLELPTNQRPWRSTPLIESVALSKAAGCRVFLKLENLQPSGSFKSRGIGNYMTRHLLSHPSPSTVHFYSSSGGNAGLACIHAANTLHRPSTIVVPLSTKPLMIAKLRAAGAHAVLQTGATWADADRHLRSELLRDNPAGVYVPPFDHPDVWAGNSTLVGEVAAQLEAEGVREGVPAAVVCSVGGGGLLNGICEGVEAKGWFGRGATVVAVETRGAESLNRSVESGELVTLEGITSMATSLGATRRGGQVGGAGDGEAAMGCLRLADEERLLVELACGVSAALCFGGRLESAMGRKVGSEEAVVIVVCGGSNVTVEMLAQWRREFGHVE
ncbi:tryptophan synthase beta subunit-like PLP-dependent enzyme [Macrophomina phaseolina]|uniref:L-serine ammonia-lyase n=1 Tax=Macrophomina phaseolina TaxID=35725 RepID=A0ABQ8GE11_9PEZI|nr:tryptophan synthase beta subunit-like PLP-dependent enzyme [Macrophomina phaseolina]